MAVGTVVAVATGGWVGAGVSVGGGAGAAIGSTVGVAVTVGSGVGVASTSLMVRAKMLRLSTSAVATEVEKSTAVGSGSHRASAAMKCWITMLDSSPSARVASSALRRTVIVIGFASLTGTDPACGALLTDRSNTLSDSTKPAGMAGTC